MDSDKLDDNLDVTFNQNNEKGSSEGSALGKSVQHHHPKQISLEIDEILHQLGGFGCWQWLNFFLLSLPSAVSGFILLTFSFTGKFIFIFIVNLYHFLHLIMNLRLYLNSMNTDIVSS